MNLISKEQLQHDLERELRWSREQLDHIEKETAGDQCSMTSIVDITDKLERSIRRLRTCATQIAIQSREE